MSLKPKTFNVAISLVLSLILIIVKLYKTVIARKVEKAIIIKEEGKTDERNTA